MASLKLCDELALKLCDENYMFSNLFSGGGDKKVYLMLSEIS